MAQINKTRPNQEMTKPAEHKRPTGKCATSNTLSALSLVFAFISILIILTYLFGLIVVASAAQQDTEQAIIAYIKLMHYIFFGCCVVYCVLGIINCCFYGSIRREHYELTAAPMYLWISGMSVNLVFNVMGIIFNTTNIWYLGIVFFAFACAGTIPFIIGCFTALKAIKKHTLGK